MTTVSIIMPVLNEAATLARQANALRALREHAEWVVVDGGSDDQSLALAAEWSHQSTVTSAGRATQMNAGASLASGDYLLFLHADTRLPADFARFIAELDRQRPGWGFFTVTLVPRLRGLALVQCLMNWRSRLTRVATGDQALFVRRDLFEVVGGFPAIPLMEDVALSKQLRRRARPWVWPTPVQTSSRRWQQHGVVKTVLLMWHLRLLYFLGVSPHHLHRRYYR